MSGLAPDEHRETEKGSGMARDYFLKSIKSDGTTEMGAPIFFIYIASR